MDNSIKNNNIEHTQKYYNEVYSECEYIVNSPDITWPQFLDKFQIVDEDYYCFILILKFGLSKAKEIINRS